MNPIVKLCIVGLALIISACGKESIEANLIPCIPDELQTNVVGFYPFTNGTLNDLSGNDQDLTNPTTASPVADRNGNTNCAFGFNNLPNSGEYLTRVDPTSFENLNDFSISFWYQPLDTTRDGGIFEHLVSNYTSPDWSQEDRIWTIGLYDCRKAVFLKTNSVWDNNITDFNCEEEVTTRTNSWHHLVATYQDSAVEMVIYRDGQLQNTQIGHYPGNTPTPNNLGDLFIGQFYNGQIDDIIIFNKALNQQEVNSLSKMEPCCAE